MASRGAALLAALLASGCSAEVLHGLDEAQANEALLALAEAGVDADKAGGDRSGHYAVLVPRDEQSRALRLLAERGLPRAPGRGMAESFAEAGLLPSETAERARLQAALGADLERTLSGLAGVEVARVVVALPPRQLLRLDAARGRSTASVVLRVRGVPQVGEGEVRRLVAAGVEGMMESDVTVAVTRQPEPPIDPSRPTRIRLGPSWVSPRDITVLVLSSLALALAALALLVLRGGPRHASPARRGLGRES